MVGTDKNIERIESVMKEAGILDKTETLEKNYGYSVTMSEGKYSIKNENSVIATYDPNGNKLIVDRGAIPENPHVALKRAKLSSDVNYEYEYSEGLYKIYDTSKNTYLDLRYDMIAGKAKATATTIISNETLRNDIKNEFQLKDAKGIPEQLVDFNHKYRDDVNIRPLVLDNLNTLIRQTCLDKSIFGGVSINEKLNALLEVYSRANTAEPARKEGESGKDYATRMAFSNPVLFAKRSKDAEKFKGDDYLSKIGAYTNKEIVDKILVAPNAKNRIDIKKPGKGDVEIKEITEGNKKGFLGRKNPTFIIEGKTEDGKPFKIELTQKRFNKMFVEKDQKFVSFDNPVINDKFGRKMKASSEEIKPVTKASSQSTMQVHHYADEFAQRSHSAGDLTKITDKSVVDKLLDKKYPGLSTDRTDPKPDKPNIKFKVVEDKIGGNVKVSATYIGVDDKKQTVEHKLTKSEFREMFSSDKNATLKFENSSLSSKFSKPEAVITK